MGVPLTCVTPSTSASASASVSASVSLARTSIVAGTSSVAVNVSAVATGVSLTGVTRPLTTAVAVAPLGSATVYAKLVGPLKFGFGV